MINDNYFSPEPIPSDAGIITDADQIKAPIKKRKFCITISFPATIII